MMWLFAIVVAVLLINEIGNYSCQTLVQYMPQGGYLLAVQADGPWGVRFSR